MSPNNSVFTNSWDSIGSGGSFLLMSLNSVFMCGTDSCDESIDSVFARPLDSYQPRSSLKPERLTIKSRFRKAFKVNWRLCFNCDGLISVLFIIEALGLPSERGVETKY